MARVDARVTDLERGTLPPVCAKTGGPADSYVRFEASSSPGWTWLLLLFGIFPFLIASFFSTVRVVGLIPLSETARRRIMLFNRLSAGSIIAALVVIVIGIAAGRGVFLVGLAMLLAALVVVLVGAPLALPTGQVSGDWVALSSVHPVFVRELDRFYDR